MLRCSKCSYGWNPDTATTCVQCKSPLTAAAPSGGAAVVDRAAGQAVGRVAESNRRQTVAEGVSTGDFASGPGGAPASVPGRSTPTPPPPFPVAKIPLTPEAIKAVEPLASQRRGSEPTINEPGFNNSGSNKSGFNEPRFVESASPQSMPPPSAPPGQAPAKAEMPKFEAPELETPSLEVVKVPPQVSEEPRWRDSLAADRAERRRTVFAGAATSGEMPVGALPSFQTAQPAPFNSGQRRPQTLSVDPNRKIVGVLITYSWLETGQIFPVLEGRNLIGKDPEQCDIAIPQDVTLSAVNSFILFRKNFIVGDKVSMSGTDVDGEPIESEFVPLKNYARIRTGSTHWTFVAMQPPGAQPAEVTTSELRGEI